VLALFAGTFASSVVLRKSWLRVVGPGFWSVWVGDCRSVGGRVSSALSLVDKQGWLTLVGVFTGRSGLQSA